MRAVPPRAKVLIDRLPARLEGRALMPVIGKLRDGPHNVTLDASQVEALAATGLEGLLVIAATQAARGNSVKIENASEAFLADLALMGVSPDQLRGTAP